MKERTLVYAKILFLILSINLFLCTDIVECTERLLGFVNPILEENEIPILNPMHNPDFKFYNGVKFGELSAAESDTKYIENFLRYIHDNNKEVVFLEIILKIDKSWEKTKLFENLKSTDEAIIFQNLSSFLQTYGSVIQNVVGNEAYASLYLHSTNKKLIWEKWVNNDDNTRKNLIEKRYYVITSEEKLQLVVNIIEKGISEFNEIYDHISYILDDLYPCQYFVNLTALKNDFNREDSNATLQNI